jgi:phage gp29-like protein
MWVSETEFVNFGEPTEKLSDQIATRGRSIDFQALGMYLPNPDTVLKKLGSDISVYRELRADAHVGGCIRRRKAAVKALEWGVDKEKSKSRTSKNIEAMLRDLDMNRILSEMLDAALYGYQPMEVIWGKVGNLIMPVDIVGKPAEWFVFDTDNQLRFRTRQNMVEGEELPPKKFLIPRQDPSYENPYGFPDLSMCFWPVTFKKGGLKFWVTFTEKFGTPWVIGKHPRGTNDAEADKLLDRLEAMVQDAVAVIPDDSSVEIMDAAGKANSGEQYERLLMFCRSEVSIALLGQNQTTEANSNKASATAGLEVTQDIRDGDAQIVTTAMNQLIRWVCELNFADPGRPAFSMWEQEEVDKVMAERDEILVKSGAKLTRAYFLKTYGLAEEDLAPDVPAAPVAPEGKPALMPPLPEDDAAVDLAEGDETFPDQDALDAALDSLTEIGKLGRDARTIYEPILARIEQGAAPDELLGMLADLYPALDADGLQERLARALFVAQVWGRLNA